MGNRLATVHTYRVLATKTFPAFVGLAFFLIFSSYTHQYFSWVDPLDLHLFIFLAYTSGIFIGEGAFAMPQVKGHGVGTMGAYIMFILGGASAIFAFLILFNVYDPQPLDDGVNQFFSVVLLVASIMFFAQSHEEIFHLRKLHEALMGRYKSK